MTFVSAISNDGIGTSNALTFNVTFIDKMFDNSFEDVVASKSFDYLEFTQSISNAISFDQDSSSILYKHHMYELPEHMTQKEIITGIYLWTKEVNLNKELQTLKAH